MQDRILQCKLEFELLELWSNPWPRYMIIVPQSFMRRGIQNSAYRYKTILKTPLPKRGFQLPDTVTKNYSVRLKLDTNDFKELLTSMLQFAIILQL